jgi:enoyl-CoA hydratase/carnithine racemase
MATYETQIYTREGPVARITFNRPHVRNATNVQFYIDLLGCLDEAEEDPEVHVVVLTGTGPVFCAGQDLKFTSVATDRQIRDYGHYLRLGWDRIRRHPCPVIARVHGDALGGGMYIISRCDLVVAKKNVRFAMREINSGEQCGGTHLLTIGKARAMEINLLGRYVSGEEAERWGLINKAVDTDEALDAVVQDWVDQLVALPPLAIKETKDATNFALDLAGFDLLFQAPFGATLKYTEDRMEAKRAWVEKRKPVFKGR